MVNNNLFATKKIFDFKLSESFEYANIAPVVEKYGDTTLSQDFDFIYANADQLNFVKNNRNSIHEGITNSIWWLRFPLTNLSDSKKQMLLEIGNQDINQLQLFIVRRDTVERSKLIGDAFVFEERIIQHRHLLFPFELFPNEEVMLYLMANKHSEAFVMPIELWNKQSFLEADSDQSLFYGMYIGLLLIYLIIPFLMILIDANRLIIYYCLLVTTLFLYIIATEGFGFQFLWKTAGEDFNKVVRPTIQSIQLLALFLFGIEFYSEKKRFSNYLKYLKLGRNFILILLPIGVLLGYYLMGTAYSEVVNKLLLTLQLVLFAIGLCMIVFISCLDYYYKGEKESGAIGFVTFIHLVVAILLMGNNFQLINSGPDFHKIILANVITEVIIITSILFFKYWNLDKEKKQLELTNSQNELSIANALLKGQEHERQRIASELQNDLQPLLLQSKKIFQQNNSNENAIPIQKIKELLVQAQLEVIRISNNLIPEVLSEKTLVEAVEELCKTVGASELLKVEFNPINCTHIFSKFPKIHIYRIVQELLNNVVKHAQAKSVKITFKEIDDHLIVFVEDDGIGIENKEIGFNTLKSRVTMLGGNITFTNSNSSGLKVELKIPFSFYNENTLI